MGGRTRMAFRVKCIQFTLYLRTRAHRGKFVRMVPHGAFIAVYMINNGKTAPIRLA